jgi:nicotinamide-nucleotide amidase
MSAQSTMHIDFAKTLSAPLGAALTALGAEVASCESCTAGALADAISWEAGASAWFTHGWTCYSAKAKRDQAGVPEELILAKGVVSAEVALAMARGAASRAGARFGVATTGLAGPGGAQSPGGPLPQGLVWIAAVDMRGEASCASHVFEGDRSEVRAAAACSAMGLLLDLAGRAPKLSGA